MSLESAIVNNGKNRGGTCGVRIILDQLPVEDAATLRRLMSAVHPTVNPDAKKVHVHSARQIAAGLTEEYPHLAVHPDTLQRHRTGGCACDAV